MPCNAHIPKDFSGVITIKHSKDILYEAAYGFVDIANQSPNRVDTKFVTAAAGKAFTATGILQLIERGMLSLNSTLGELLDFDLKQIDPSATVRQLTLSAARSVRLLVICMDLDRIKLFSIAVVSPLLAWAIAEASSVRCGQMRGTTHSRNPLSAVHQPGTR